MKMQMTLKLLKNFQRPVVELSKMKNIIALLDTGALFPVFTGSLNMLKSFGAVLAKRNVKFGGFGGNNAIGDMYKIPYFELGNLIYPDLHVIYCERKDYKVDMIISATMFQNLIYQIDDKNKKLNIDIPNGESNIKNLVLKYDDNNKIKVLVTNGDVDTSSQNNNKFNLDSIGF